MYYSVKHRTPDSPILFLRQKHVALAALKFFALTQIRLLRLSDRWDERVCPTTPGLEPDLTNERSTVRGSQPSHGTLMNFFLSRLSSGSRFLPARVLWKLGLQPGAQPTAPGPRLYPIAEEQHRSRRHRIFRLRYQAATGNKWASRKLKGVSC